MTDIAIAARNLSKRFSLSSDRRSGIKDRVLRRGETVSGEEVWALRDASFEVPRGSSFGLIGHNGAGKSTALKVLTGIYEPTSGSVEVHGRVSALLELGSGFHPELSGRDNIRLNASILGLSKRQIDGAMDQIIEFADIGPFIDTPVKAYSSGMYARLGFAVAVNLDPDILIVDEILAVGDEAFQRKCNDHMYELRKRGTTIVMVSHSMATIVRTCDHAAWLDHGEVRGIGTSADVVRHYLDDVNAHQADHGSAPMSAGPGLGSGEVRVTDLRFVHEDGEETTELLTGEPATFRVSYRAVTDLADACIGLGMYADSTFVAGPRSQPTLIRAGEGTAEFSVDRLSLSPGIYDITSIVSAHHHWIDVRERAFQLKVRGRGEENDGMVQMDGVWTL